MHRVYNSAFMNMLKTEENEKYRMSIKNVLEFNPQILKRYVNFMNNPDEETALAQFGNDDKYFGVCILMSTLPGLPMFGHGQIEGFSEKYGMEYKRAYWDESVNVGLVQRHEREIFPLLRKRYLFSGVQNFLLYDFFTSDSSVNENVFAYGNRVNDERSLIFYHNKFDRTAGWIQTSAAYLENNQLVQKTLGEGLNIGRDHELFLCFRDYITGLEYIRSCEEIWNSGLYIELEAFKYQVFLDFREVRHTAERPYADLNRNLNGTGVYSIEVAMDEYIYQPVLNAFNECINSGSLKWLAKGCSDKKVLKSFGEKLNHLNKSVCDFENFKSLTKKELTKFQNQNKTALKLFVNKTNKDMLKLNKTVVKNISIHFANIQGDQLDNLRILLILPFLQTLRLLYVQDKKIADSFFESRLYDKRIIQSFKELGVNDIIIQQEIHLLKILSSFKDGLNIDRDNPALPFFEELFNEKDAQRYLQMNEFNGVIYFNKELFEKLLFWLFLNCTIQLVLSDPEKFPVNKINNIYRDMNKYIKIAEKCGYKGEDFLTELERK
jgi:hypothetical protein